MSINDMKNANLRFINVSPVILLGIFYLFGGIVALLDPRTRVGQFFASGAVSETLISFVIGLGGIIVGLAMLLYQHYGTRWYALFTIPSLFYSGATAAILLYTRDQPTISAVIYFAVLALGLQNIDLAGDLQARESALLAKDAEIASLKEQLAAKGVKA